MHRKPQETSLERHPLLAFFVLWTAVTAFVLVTAVALFGALSGLATPLAAEPLQLPWREAGLTEREAAAHLLDRFAFGPRPGEVDRVVAAGLATWMEGQLAAQQPESALEARLRTFEALRMTPREIADTYPNPGMVLMRASRAGVVDRESLQAAEPPSGELNPERRKVREWARSQGYRPQREMLETLASWKVLSALYAENQLEQVMTDFWSNHFYISRADNEVRSFLLSYERDAVRPHALGDFADLLGATARHPAMLLYLDNARSTAAEGARKTFDREQFQQRQRQQGRRAVSGRAEFGRAGEGRRPDGAPARQRSTGLNENYARELLELHTLGVEGGYTQKDVVEVARAFTGWTVIPPGEGRERVERMLRRNPQAARMGFVVDLDGLFLFRADAHDAGAKTVLGRTLPAGRGMEDGEAVLALVAHHPSTAQHLAAKLAVRFVSDAPPEALVERLAATFSATGGDIRQVLRTLVESPEFWSQEASRGQKIKSPFELTISALRTTGAEVLDARGVVRALEGLGQPLWGYQAPTGYPDRADFWVNIGALLARMNFGLELAAGRVPGVRLDLPKLLEGREPESAEEALEAYLPLLLPERDLTETLPRLRPLVRDPKLPEKVEAKAPAGAPPMADGEMEALLFPGLEDDAESERLGREPSAVAQVVGVILGSPEFQRR